MTLPLQDPSLATEGLGIPSRPPAFLRGGCVSGPR
jgi:hypothetical protein